MLTGDRVLGMARILGHYEYSGPHPEPISIPKKFHTPQHHQKILDQPFSKFTRLTPSIPGPQIKMARMIFRSIKKRVVARPPATYTPKIPLTQAIKEGITTKPIRVKQASVRTLPKPERSIQILKEASKLIEEGKPHFKVGGKKIYFPTAKVVLLRPNAKHTPYQAKFAVPRYFNKLDLRDYLYHVYGLRALNVTTQLLWARWTRQTPRSPRYRETQIKKMTIDMADPFVWPEQPSEVELDKMLNLTLIKELEKYNKETSERFGSDKNKPITAFGGLIGPFPEGAKPFVPRFFKKAADEAKEKVASANQKAEEEELVRRFLKL